MAKEFAKKFYKSKEWKRCREAYIKSVFGLCQKCSKPGVIVHHKKHLTPTNINDYEVSLGFENLELLCLECHNEHHKFEREKQYVTRKGLKFNKNGDLIKT